MRSNITLVFAVLLLITGCNTIINSFELNKLIDKCKDHGGVFQLYANSDGNHTASCQNGTWVKVK